MQRKCQCIYTRCFGSVDKIMCTKQPIRHGIEIEYAAERSLLMLILFTAAQVFKFLLIGK